MPYGRGNFDSERFKETFEAVHEEGNCDTWLRFTRQIRKSDRLEPNIYMIGSLASALIEP